MIVEIARRVREVTKNIWSEFLKIIGDVYGGGEDKVSGEEGSA